MLTPEYLAGIADDLVELYSELDDLIVRDIVRRLVKAGNITETARWQAQKAQESGLLYEDVIKKVSQLSTASEAQIRQLFEDAGVKALEFDCSIYEKAGFSPVPIRQSESAARVLVAGISKTNGLLKNLTRTTAVSAQRTYIHAAAVAEMQITSGAFDPYTAIRNAVNTAVQDGVQILYPTGHRDRVDVAVRRAVVTGVSQTTGEISLQYAGDMGCDLMELSAHFGARPSHAAWQGKIVSLSGRHGYLSLDEIGYGTGAGFKGWNCRHDWYPYFEGISRRAYSEQRLKEYSNKKVRYNDEEIPYYEATQKQREMERKIRESRRRLAGYDEAIKKADKQTAAAIQADFDRAAVELKQREAAYRDFAHQTGLSRQNGRIQVSGFGRSLSRRAVQANKRSGIINLPHYEEWALNRYVSSESYKINGVLRSGAPLTKEQKRFVRYLDSALEKTPNYNGTVYRSITADEIPDIAAFFRGHQVGSKINFSQYLSCSTEVFAKEFPVQYVIKSRTGKDIRTYNPREHEILYPRNSIFLVHKVENHIIYLVEV